MRIGVIYYSRTGNTKLVAEKLREKLKNKKINVELVEIQHTKKPGFFKAGYAAIKQKELPITNIDFNIEKYDLLLIGSPIWVGKPAPFVKTFINKAENTKDKKAMVFLTCRSKPDKYVNTAKIISKYLEKLNIETTDEPLILKMKKKQILSDEQKIDKFVEKIIKLE